MFSLQSLQKPFDNNLQNTSAREKEVDVVVLLFCLDFGTLSEVLSTDELINFKLNGAAISKQFWNRN